MLVAVKSARCHQLWGRVLDLALLNGHALRTGDFAVDQPIRGNVEPAIVLARSRAGACPTPKTPVSFSHPVPRIASSHAPSQPAHSQDAQYVKTPPPPDQMPSLTLSHSSFMPPPTLATPCRPKGRTPCLAAIRKSQSGDPQRFPSKTKRRRRQVLLTCLPRHAYTHAVHHSCFQRPALKPGQSVTTAWPFCSGSKRTRRPVQSRAHGKTAHHVRSVLWPA